MRNFFAACYRMLKSPWALLIFSVIVMVVGICAVFELGSSFHSDSFAAGLILGLGFNCFGDAICQLIPLHEKND